MKLKYKDHIKNLIFILVFFINSLMLIAGQSLLDGKSVERSSSKELFDYGDAPDTGNGNGNGDYKTLGTSGARHKKVFEGPYFGERVDYESEEDIIPLGINADADDKNQSNYYLGNSSGDDEDGIISVNGIIYTNGPIYLREGASKQDKKKNIIKIKVKGVRKESPAKVKIWLDGSNNGNINSTFDNGEYIYDQKIDSSGEIDIDFYLPKLDKERTYLRMRIASTKKSNDVLNQAGGTEEDGEVEDYAVIIETVKGEIEKTGKISTTDATLVNYTVTLKNTGNVLIPLNTLKDTILTEDREYIVSTSGSYRYDSSIDTNDKTGTYAYASGVISFNGLPASIAAGEIVTLSYDVKIDSSKYTPTNPNITNTVSILIDNKDEKAESTVELAKVNKGTISKVGKISTTDATLVNYTVTLKNTGNVLIPLNTLKDTILTEDREYIVSTSGSYRYDSSIDTNDKTGTYTYASGVISFNGLPASIVAGEIVTLSYDVKIDSSKYTPTNPNITNTVSILIDNKDEKAESTVELAKVNKGTISKVGKISTTDATLVNYTVTLKNTGNVLIPLNTLKDTILTEDREYIVSTSGSYRYDSSIDTNDKTGTYAYASGVISFNGLPASIAAGEIVTLSYDVKIDSSKYTPTNPNITNTVSILIDNKDEKAESTVELAKVNKGTISKVGKISTTDATLVNYTVTLKNTGNVLIPLNTLKDTILTEDREYIVSTSGSYRYDSSIDTNDKTGTYAYASGVISFNGLPASIVAGEIVTLSYDVKIDSSKYTPTNPNITNTVSILIDNKDEKAESTVELAKVNKGTISKVGKISTTDATLVNYTVTLKNTGNVLIPLNTLKDTILTEDREYIVSTSGSYRYDSSIDTNDKTGTYTYASGVISFNGLPASIAAGEIVTLSYDVKIDSSKYTPTNPNITNTVSILIDNKDEKAESTVELAKVNKGTISKVGKISTTDATLVNYTVTLKNTGNVLIPLNTLKDTILTEDREYIVSTSGSYRYDSSIDTNDKTGTYAYASGVISFNGLPASIVAGEIVTLSYDVKIDSSKYTPTNPNITNTVSILIDNKDEKAESTVELAKVNKGTISKVGKISTTDATLVNYTVTLYIL
ncbi:GEVED domain-containing protein [Cetobacterium somerae]|uniref:GEVED domain-containing protein n=1 Tax=Cetobacterium sp. NK01 TaxID=2993530 RepID=UPI00211723AE|nr:GEVED domain-containing protein [Cetobacterium sp. NK01]MCQ8212240.1 GEVED domain-containing protein [Cetobacterium sp. NK01]